MNRDEFINAYVVSFLATDAARMYRKPNERFHPSWYENQPVNDARTLAEAAWDSVQRSAKPSSDATTGSAGSAVSETGSIPIT